jgi:arginine decarboxylase
MDARSQHRRIDKFFSGPGARADDWRDLLEAAKGWSGGSGHRSQFEALLTELAVTEEYHAYPGCHLIAAMWRSTTRRASRCRSR